MSPLGWVIAAAIALQFAIVITPRSAPLTGFQRLPPVSCVVEDRRDQIAVWLDEHPF
jgi:hypothetical protein